MLNALILIGGKSSRMGTDKFLLSPHGKPQYIHLSELLKSLKLPVHISCNREQESMLDTKEPLILDQFDAIGPMGGIASAFAHQADASWLVVAVDLIHLDQENITELISHYDSSVDVITFQRKGQRFLETTCTIYNPSSFEHISQAIQDYKFGLQSVLNSSKTKVVEVIDGAFLRNANTPSDLSSS